VEQEKSEMNAAVDNWNIYDEFRDMVARPTRDKVAPYAAEIDRTSEPPIKAFEAFKENGLLGLPFPEEFGGQDGDMMTQVIAIEEVARACLSSSFALCSGWGTLDPLVRYGSEELKREIIPQISKGEAISAWCLTEPQGGTDIMAATTRAVARDGGWVINGTKRFITNAGWADWYLVLAKTEGNEFGIFMVHRDDPGISFPRLERKMGLRASPTGDVVFEDCWIPGSRVVGGDTGGYARMMRSLTASRPLIAAGALGLAQGALDEAVKYTQERKSMGESLSRYQMIRGMVGDMAIKVEAARSLLYRSVEMIDTAPPADVRAFASMAKTFCSDVAMQVTTDAVQLHGGYGYIDEYPVERMMRDAKITQIYEGTNQIQRLIIAKYLYQD
jgi:alkylation response protein AidB-like acyl-CoA dehydrogenase